MLDDDSIFNPIPSEAPSSDTCLCLSWDHGRSVKEVDSEDEGISQGDGVRSSLRGTRGPSVRTRQLLQRAVGRHF